MDNKLLRDKLEKERFNTVIDTLEDISEDISDGVNKTKTIADSIKEMTDALTENYSALRNITKGADGTDGKDGYTPIKGQDYFTDEEITQIKGDITPTKETLTNIIKPLIPRPIKGKDGKDGKDANEIEIIEQVIRRIPKPKDGKNGKNAKEVEGVDIINKINGLIDDENLKIDAVHIKNLPSMKGAMGGNRFLSKLADVTITGLANDEVLKWDSTLNKWVNGTAGGGTPGGSDTQLQYNNAGAFGGLSNSAYIPGTSLTIGADNNASGVGNILYLNGGNGATAGQVYLTGGGATDSTFPGGEVVLSGGNNSIAAAINAGPGTITAYGSVDDGATGATGGSVSLIAGSGADSTSSSLFNAGGLIQANGGSGIAGGDIYLQGGGYDPFGFVQQGGLVQAYGSTYTATGGVAISSGSGLAGGSADVSTGDIDISTGTPVGAGTKGKVNISAQTRLSLYGVGTYTGTSARMLSVDSSGNIIESYPIVTSGSFGITFTVSGTTSLTLPTSGTLATLAGTETFTNKRITKRVLAITSNPTTPTVNTDSYDVVHITSQTNNMAFGANFTGTPVDGDTLRISVTSSSGSPTMTWSSLFESSTITLPAVTNGTARIDIGFFWNSETSKWRCVSTS